ELRKKFGEMIKKYKEESNVPADFDYVDTLSWQDDDKTVYRDAITLLDEKQGVKAYEMLKELRQKYEDTLIEDCIIMRMTDCMLTVDTDFEEVEKTREEALGLLAGILDGGKYSPVFSDVFYRWRTTTQSFHHGMSNMSNIPNKEYNAVRWRLINIIKQHLEKNPDDLRAKGQIDMLLLLPNILRGGAYGNLNILHFGVLYTDTYKDKAA
ncbi:MAG: hypothetical protein KKH94_12885, partial [Candidatus Omnitrophica bacterium]|nr:hypothetical protein [Candidatus Omnitrophota bacterium]